MSCCLPCCRPDYEEIADAPVLGQPAGQQKPETPGPHKIVMLGDAGVGKSCLILQYADQVFTGKFISTIGVDFKTTTEKIGDDEIRLQVWDTAGQDRFRTISSSYYKGAKGLVLVFDLTDKSSFDHLPTWIQEIESNCELEQVSKVLVGNKVDLASERVVTQEEAQKFCLVHRFQYFETSATSYESTRQPFRWLAEQLREPTMPSSQPVDPKIDGILERRAAARAKRNNPSGCTLM